MSAFDHFVGTRPVSGTHAFDILALEAWLSARLPGFAGPLSVEMFKGGQSNPTYKLITPSRQYVMRAKPGPVAKLLPSAHAIEREFAVMQGLHGTDVPGTAGWQDPWHWSFKLSAKSPRKVDCCGRNGSGNQPG